MEKYYADQIGNISRKDALIKPFLNIVNLK